MPAVDAAAGVESVDEALLAAVRSPALQAVAGFFLGTGVSRDARGEVVKKGGHGLRNAASGNDTGEWGLRQRCMRCGSGRMRSSRGGCSVISFIPGMRKILFAIRRGAGMSLTRWRATCRDCG